MQKTKIAIYYSRLTTQNLLFLYTFANSSTSEAVNINGIVTGKQYNNFKTDLINYFKPVKFYSKDL